MSERLRYVLVEASCTPKLLGGRVASEITGPESMRPRSSAAARAQRTAGITGTNTSRSTTSSRRRRCCVRLDARQRLDPSAPSTVTELINSASEIMDRLRKLDVERTLAQPQHPDW